MALIEVNHVTKEFRIEEQPSLWHVVGNGVRRLAGRAEARRPLFKALDDIDFRVEKGEVLGIIGSNGAGKSTLLKLLSRITGPTLGSVRVTGTVAPLIEVGAGLISDLSGRENIYLNGAILGMSRAQINRKFDDIIAFAELEKFVDTPVKKYSSGMTIRLGFSIATSVDADILIVDEVLAVGDLAFQRKCFDRMEDMIKRQGKTVLLVSHNIRQVERLCTRTILLDHGKVVAEGSPKQVCELFYERSDAKIKLMSQQGATAQWANAVVTEDVLVTEISLLDAKSRKTETVRYREDMTLRLRFTVRQPIESPVFGVGVHTPDMLYLTTHNSDDQIIVDKLPCGEYESLCHIRQCPLLPGVYGLRVGIATRDGAHMLFYAENLIHFQVVLNPEIDILKANRHGFFEMDAHWRSDGMVEAAGNAALLSSMRQNV